MSRFINPIPQYTLANGDLAVGATLTFYEGGTDTLLNIYADVNESISIANPVVLGSRGEVPNIFFSASARCVLTDADGNQIFDIDPVNSEQSTGAYEIWNSNIVYERSDIVFGSNGQPYISLVSSNQSNDPTLNEGNNSFWAQLVLPQIWNAQVAYQPNELAVENGVVYRSLISDNSGNQPSTDNGTQWKSIANAVYTTYDNVSSGLVAVTAQGAIDEIVNLINNLPSSVVYRGQLDVSSGDSALPATPSNGDLYVIAVAGTITVSTAGGTPVATAVAVGEQIIYNGDTGNWDLIAAVTQASTVSYNNNASGLTATNVQNAIDEVESRVDTAESNITGNVNTLSLHDGRLDSLEAFEASAGSAVTYDVTTSATDTTANRLLKVGDFGVGSLDCPTITNLETEEVGAGLYKFRADYIGAPSETSNTTLWYSCLVTQNLQDRVTFLAQLVTGGSPRLFLGERIGKIGTIRWEEVYNSGNTGTAVTRDVTTSATDTTAGRLLKVGDFGIGRVSGTLGSISNADLNTYMTAGNYFINQSGSTNLPNAINGYLTVIASSSASYAKQTYTLVTTLKIYERVNINGTWSSWQELYHTGNTGTAVTRDVTTSTTDTTAGRLTKVGDFGLGGNTLPSVADIDALSNVYTAFYTTTGTEIGAPSGAQAGVLLHYQRLARPVQEWIEYAGNSRYWRRFGASGWSPWQELYHSGNSKNVGVTNTTASGAVNQNITRLGGITEISVLTSAPCALNLVSSEYSNTDTVVINKQAIGGLLTITSDVNIRLPDASLSTSHTLSAGYIAVIKLYKAANLWWLTIS